MGVGWGWGVSSLSLDSFLLSLGIFSPPVSCTVFALGSTNSAVRHTVSQKMCLDALSEMPMMERPQTRKLSSTLFFHHCSPAESKTLDARHSLRMWMQGWVPRLSRCCLDLF